MKIAVSATARANERRRRPFEAISRGAGILIASRRAFAVFLTFVIITPTAIGLLAPPVFAAASTPPEPAAVRFVTWLPLLIGAGALAGFLAGLLGIGGGIVMTPVLFLVLGRLDVPAEWHMHMVVATSLAVIVPTGLTSARAHWRRHSLDPAILRRWAPWIAVGALSGTLLARHLTSETMGDIFGVVAALLGVKMLLPLDRLRLGDTLPERRIADIFPFSVGMLSSLMGIGGATFTVPWLTLFGIPIHRAVGTASAIGVMIALIGVAGYVAGGSNLGIGTAVPWHLGFVHLPAALGIAPAAMLAAPWGARAAHALPHRALSAVFGVFLLLAAARIAAG
ncbi:MAG: sulfite exporter TauE/SafE family protein [Alphaproteobacteria bacterium]|nr:MAG: sulfite exporter TauE/SafE family protein [Alphaproteobacteria bacterium]